jgi:hypothetical protein
MISRRGTGAYWRRDKREGCCLQPFLTFSNPEFALGIPEIIGGRVKRVKK